MTTRVEMARLFQEAVRLDPDYALAWARLSQVFLRSRRGGDDRSVATAIKARGAAADAIRLAPELPEAHLSMAMVRLLVDYDHDATQRELDEVERLSPNHPEIPAIRAMLDYARGRWDDRLANVIARAVELDPQNSSSLNDLGLILSWAGRFAEAEKLFSRSWALSQSFYGPIRYRSENYLTWTGDVKGALEIINTVPDTLRDNGLFYRVRGAQLAQSGAIAAAMADYEHVRSIATRNGFPTSGAWSDHLWVTYYLARLEARIGHAGRARELDTEALAGARKFADDFPNEYRTGSYLARIHAARGEKAAALAAIGDAMRIAVGSRDADQIATVKKTKAEMLIALGEIDAAIEELRAVHEMGWAFGYLLRLQLEWEPLRGDAKFQQLMKEAEARADAQPRPKK